MAARLEEAKGAKHGSTPGGGQGSQGAAMAAHPEEAKGVKELSWQHTLEEAKGAKELGPFRPSPWLSWPLGILVMVMPLHSL